MSSRRSQVKNRRKKRKVKMGLKSNVLGSSGANID